MLNIKDYVGKCFAIPYLIDKYGFTKADLGTVGVALSLAYGFSKFIMGNVSDRSNPKYFIIFHYHRFIRFGDCKLNLRFGTGGAFFHSNYDRTCGVQRLVPRDGLPTGCENHD